MTKRILFVGNSHIGALAEAWNLLRPAYPGVHLDMFGAPGKLFRSVRVFDGAIAAKDEAAAEMFVRTGGSRTASPAEYDAVVVVAGGIGSNFMLEALRGYHPHCLMRSPDLRATVPTVPTQGQHEFDNGLDGVDARYALIGRLVPNRLFRQIMGARAQTRPAYGLVNRIAANWPNIPLYFVPTPKPSFEILDAKDNISLLADDCGWGPVLRPLVDETMDNVFKGLAQVVHPPEETVCRHLFTHPEFSRGSIRLGARGLHKKSDHCHMNRAYGLLFLKKFLISIRIGEVDHLAENPDGKEEPRSLLG